MQTATSLIRSAGFVLLEALIAIAIFSFALLGLMGMQALSIKNSADAKYRADAAYLANQLISQMWVDRANLIASSAANYSYRATATACDVSTAVPPAALTNWVADMAAVLPGVSAGASSSQKPKVVVVHDAAAGTATVTITVCWKLPSDTEAHNHVATAKISI